MELFIPDGIIIEQLFKTGHFYSPEAITYGIVKEELGGLDLKHPAVKAAIRSYQNLDYNLELLAIKHHGRSAVADGDIGPATQELLFLPRCDVPDFFAPGDPRGARAGTGSWPNPCQKNGVKVHINKSGMPSSIISKWPTIQKQVFNAYNQMGCKMVEVPTTAEANILVFFGSFFGGTIGLAEFNGRSCSDSVTCKLSNSYVGHNAGLLKHEMGHNCNLNHTRGGTMNPSIIPEINSEALWVTQDPSYNTLVRFFDGKPVDDFPPDHPPPPPPEPPTPTPTPNPPSPNPTTLWERILKWLTDNW